MMPGKLAILAAVLFFAATGLRADDGAASIAAGGLILMKREPRIAMAKEVLTIGEKVRVDYEFRNDSDEAITTEVAFPIPAYTIPDVTEAWMPNQVGFDDFKLWVDEKPVRFEIEVRAFVGKREITDLLRRLKVDAASFGHYNKDGNTAGDIVRLSATQKGLLVRAKAISHADEKDPEWTMNWRVEKKYHWTQTFPARGVVHIRHHYTPVFGNSNTVGVEPVTGKGGVEELATLCPDQNLRKKLGQYAADRDNEVPLFYVDFILTTANTWKSPIEDFTLIVERLHTSGAKETFVSFCWDGPVIRLDADRFSAHIDNLVPEKELRIGFIPVHVGYWKGTPH